MRRTVAAFILICSALLVGWQGLAQVPVTGAANRAPPSTSGPPAASDILDFAGNSATGCASLAACTSVTNSGGFAQTSTGTLTSFGANTLRRTDLGVLIEDTATNICTQSQTMDNAAWTLNDLTVSANATTAPDGTATAELFTDNSNNAVHRVFSATIAQTSGANYAMSVYVKGGTLRYVSLRAKITNSGPVYAWMTLDTTNGTITNNGASATYAVQALASGWYRISIVYATQDNNGVNLLLAGSDVSTAPGQAGPTAGGNIYVGSGQTFSAWGGQVEDNQANAPTSYITTTTTSVARTADAISITGQAQTDLQLSAYSVVVKTNNVNFLIGPRLLDAAAGGTNRLMFIGSNTSLKSSSSDNTVLTATLGSAATYTGGAVKSGIAVDGTGRSLVANNGTVVSDAKTFSATGTPTLGGPSNYLNGYVGNLSIWNSKQSNANLALDTQ